MSDAIPWCVYEYRPFAASEGRIPLELAFGQLLLSRTGTVPRELPQIFSAPVDEGENDLARDLVRLQAEIITEAFVNGDLPAFARPVGGGSLTPLPRHTWEIDDPLDRYAFAALNLEQWDNVDAEPTHRIFVHAEAFYDWAKQLQSPETLSKYQIDRIGDPLSTSKTKMDFVVQNDASLNENIEEDHSHPNDPPGVGPKLIPEKEVLKRVGIGRSTIRTRMESGKFPKKIKVGERAFWDDREIDKWILDQIDKSET